MGIGMTDRIKDDDGGLLFISINKTPITTKQRRKMSSLESPWKLPAKRVTKKDRAHALYHLGISGARNNREFKEKVSTAYMQFCVYPLGKWEKALRELVMSRASFSPRQLEAEYRRSMEKRVKTKRRAILRDRANPNGVIKIVPTVVLSCRRVELPDDVTRRVLEHVLYDLGTRLSN